MPVGIENLATGFLQGLNARKQQERQDIIDQREAERFDMQKAQFADNQAANQLSMKTNQFQLGQAKKTADRGDITWNQQQDEINRKKAFESDLRTIYSLEKEGNTEGLAKFLTEKNKTLGIKGDFERDYVTGKGALKLDKDGKAVFVHEDGSRTTYDMDDYGADFVAKFDPVTAISNKQKTAAEIAKEDRGFKQKKELVRLQAANSLAIARENNVSQEKIANIKTGAKSEASYEPLLPLAQQFFGSKLTSKQLKSTTDQISKDEFIANGMQNFKLSNVGKYISTKDMQQAEQSLNQLADSIYGQQSATGGTDTYDSPSQGKLVAKGLAPEVDAVDMSGRSKLGGQGAAQPTQPASPVSGLTVKPPVQDKENTEVAIPAKPVSKTQVLTKISGMRGSEKITKTNNPYQEIQGKFRDPIPDGFKRKKAPFGTDVRTPEYNVFVSNNYQD